jgi:hypothetical protein
MGALFPLLEDYLHVQKENARLRDDNKSLLQDNNNLRKARQVSVFVALKDAFTNPSNKQKTSTAASTKSRTKFSASSSAWLYLRLFSSTLPFTKAQNQLGAFPRKQKGALLLCASNGATLERLSYMRKWSSAV